MSIMRFPLSHARERDDANPVYLGDNLMPEPGQPAITLITAGADEALGVVTHLHNADPELLEDFHITNLVFKRIGINTSGLTRK